jgi:hypothetical protein
MCATKHRTICLQAVTDDFAAATVSLRRHDMDRAFEAVENMRLPVVPDLESLVVFVSAMLATRHEICSG